MVGLAQARFNAGIIAGSRVSEAKIPALREQCNGLLLQGQWLDASIQLTSALGRRLSFLIFPDDSDRVPILRLCMIHPERNMTKVAIVTASDSGIGKACALLLAQNGF
ncbi:lipoprotein [Salmonella sp. NCTC 11881]|nr:lipoprotein [Salmonella sp. NCTC 11881]